MSDRTNSDSTRELLARIRSGDDEAREQLLGRLLPGLRRWAEGRLPPRSRELADTEDLIQESLLRVCARLHEFEPHREGAFLAYLHQTLLNRIRDEIRASDRRPERSELPAEVADPRTRVLTQALGSRTMAAYESALETLNDEQQQAVVLRIEFGFSHAEIAQALGRPSADAARMLVARGLARLARHYPGPGGFFFVDEAWTCDNIFAGVLQNGIEPATGIKGGWTPGAQVTGLFSARSPEGGTAIAGSYRLPQGQGQAYVTDAARLLEVGLAECNAPLVFSPQSLPFLRHYPDIPALEGVLTGGGAEFPLDLARGAAFLLFRQSGESTIRAGLEVGRSMEAIVAAGGTVTVGVSPFHSHGGFRIANTGSHPVDLLLRADFPAGFGIAVSLGPGEWKVIEPEASPELLPMYALSITNDSAAGLDAHLSVEESYAFRPEIPGAAQPGAFEVVLRRDGDPSGDGFWWRVTGGDPGGDGTLLVSVHEEGTVVSVPEAESATVAPQLLSGATATPNPFTHGTPIEFDLAAAAEVSLQIYDAQGREVRSAPPHELPAGRWSVDWDGRASGGERAPAGVYFYRLHRDGRPEGGGKVVLTR